MKNDLFGTVIDIIKKAKLFFAMSLLFSIYITIRTDSITGFVTNLVLNLFAATIGLNEVIVSSLEQMSKASGRINDHHFSQLVADTEKLALISKMLSPENSDSDKASKATEYINRMISENIEIINIIKSAKNGVEK